MRIHFNVVNDIVFGLKFVNNVYKMLAKGLFFIIQSIRMRIKWAVSLLKINRMFSTFLGFKPLQDS